MINKNKLEECHPKLKELATVLERLAKDKYNSEVIVTSGARDGGGKSWHDKKRGAVAIDFVFKGLHTFAILSELNRLCEENKGIWGEVTELEVCAGYSYRNKRYQNHIHMALGNEGYLQKFTGKYV